MRNRCRRVLLFCLAVAASCENFAAAQQPSLSTWMTWAGEIPAIWAPTRSRLLIENGTDE